MVIIGYQIYRIGNPAFHEIFRQLLNLQILLVSELAQVMLYVKTIPPFAVLTIFRLLYSSIRKLNYFLEFAVAAFKMRIFHLWIDIWCFYDYSFHRNQFPYGFRVEVLQAWNLLISKMIYNCLQAILLPSSIASGNILCWCFCIILLIKIFQDMIE